LEGEYIPDKEAIVKAVVDQFQKIQAHMKNACEENASKTSDGY
jgi:hypothetical protein